MNTGPRRRTVIAGAPLALAAAGCTSTRPERPAATWRFFTGHEAAVVADATARIAPGPDDDPAEKGHPGAREANVTGYIDTLLSALDASPPRIFAGGPWSDRHTGGPDLMARFTEPDPVALIAWRQRIEGWQRQYRAGVRTLDRLAGGDFTQATPDRQDELLTKPAASTFLLLLFEHTVEGLYACPEYGGNRDLAGWRDIGYPGDSQPRGYAPADVTGAGAPDAAEMTPIVTQALHLLGAL